MRHSCLHHDVANNQERLALSGHGEAMPSASRKRDAFLPGVGRGVGDTAVIELQPPILAEHSGETVAEAAERLASDLEQYQALVDVGFTGPVYERFRDELWDYAMRVMHEFMLRGRIVELCESRNAPVSVSNLARRAMHTSQDTRDEIAVDSIAWTEKYFREEILIKGRWRPKPGAASIRSYFIGACAFGFRRALRNWESAHKDEWLRADATTVIDRVADTLDPAERAAIMDFLRRILKDAPPEARHICSLILQDLSHTEIADQLGISTRAVEGYLYRLRKRARRLARNDRSRSREHHVPRPLGETA
jgi:RNA polymerase sigma factor (sigma-70 family)